MKGHENQKEISVSVLAECLGRVGLFADLEEDIRLEIAQGIKTMELARNETLVRQGDEAESMFMLIDGRLSVIIVNATGAAQTVGQLEAGSIIGEIALVAGGRRSATVVAKDSSIVGLLKVEMLNHLMDKYPQVTSGIVSMAAHRLRMGQLALHLTRLFDNLEPGFVDELQTAVEWISLTAGDTLYRAGDPADACYLVVSGRLRALDRERVYSPDVTSGDLTGDLAMILGETHQVTMAAVRDTEVARIAHADFEDWTVRYPRIMLDLARAAFTRERSPASVARKSLGYKRSVGLVCIDDNLDIATFNERFEKEVAKYGDAITLSSEKVDWLLQKPGISQSFADSPENVRLLQWLDEVENAHRYVIYLADCRQCEWSNRVIRQADHVVFVAEATADEHLREIEQNHYHLFEKDPLRASVLLVHDADATLPEQTDRWHKQRSIDMVYHMRRGHEQDLSRFARLMTGHAVSLVFGGGGARGFAHLGVLQALEELGVPIDIVAGTSIGAPIAFAPAQGMDAGQALAAVNKAFQSLLDYTLPLASMLAGKRITRCIEDYARSLDIEDLWLPYFCISTNMTRARSVVHRRGNLAHAMRASVSIPGVLPPVPFGVDLHVDGGILNNLPIDVMRQINPTGPLIAVDVIPPMGPRAKSDFPTGLSGWRLLFNRLLPWLKLIRVPSIGSTIMASMTIGSAGYLKGMLKGELADLYLSINVKGISMLKFENFDKIAEIGYQQSIEPLRQWLTAEHPALDKAQLNQSKRISTV